MEILDNARHHQFEARLGAEVAFLTYTLSGSRISLDHVEVPPSYRGQGIASRLTRHALERAREQGLAVIPVCPFVKAYVRKHAEYRPLLVDP